MIRAIRFIMVAAVLAVVAVSTLNCAPGNRFNYVGTWEADRQLEKPTDPNISEAARDAASRVILTLKVDGTFTLIDAGIPKDGEYQIASDHVVLDVKKIMNQPMSSQPPDVQQMNVPINVTPIKGEDALRFYDPKGFDRTGLVMHRWKDAKTLPSSP